MALSLFKNVNHIYAVVARAKFSCVGKGSHCLAQSVSSHVALLPSELQRHNYANLEDILVSGVWLDSVHPIPREQPRDC